MTRDDIREFVATLHEPAVVVLTDGTFTIENDAFKRLLRSYGLEEASGLKQAVDDDDGSVADFLAGCARTRPALQTGLHFQIEERRDRYACSGGLLRPGRDGEPPLLLLRFNRSQEAVRRFQLLGRKIDEMNAEMRRRIAVEAELREVQRTLEQRVAERTSELERANRELVRSNTSLQDFAYVASHELREPLRKIVVFSDMLLDDIGGELSTDQRSIFDRMVDAARRMDRLIESLLEYSRVSTRKPVFSPVSLDDVVRDVLSDLEVLIDRTGGSVEIGDLPDVHADEALMRQLFQNLISNGLKFRKSDVPARVTVEAVGDSAVEAVIEVRDNGIGFEAKFAEEIFDPFRRLNPRHEYDGAGIGLAVCRRIAERHDGRISGESVVGQGARFRVHLPQHSAPPVTSAR